MQGIIKLKLEQLERLRSEDTPRRLMITHTIESYWIPSQKMTKSKLQILKIRQNFKFLNFETDINATHLLKLLDKMCIYKMDLMSIVEDAASWLPIPLSHIGSQVKRWQSQSYKI